MKIFQKFFQYSRKLEELQTARKAKEVDEVRKFDVQMEAQKQRTLDRHLKSERAQDEQRIQALEHLAISEEAWMTVQEQRLQKVEEFNEQAQRSKTDAFYNDFGQFLEFQESTFESVPDGYTALFSATCDVFTNELSDVTESELQREAQQNDEAIYANQESPPRPQSTVLETGYSETEGERPFDEGVPIIDKEHAPDTQEQEAERRTTPPSASNVFYFRQISPPPKK